MKSKILRNIILILATSIALAIFVFDKMSVEDEQFTNVVNPTSNNDVNYDLNDEGIIKTEVAKKVIEKTANELMNAIKNKDEDTIAEYVHPMKGVRFTPYTTVSTEKDLIFNKENIKSFFKDESLYVWGNYDGIGDEIKLTPSQYYEKFIYSEDFLSAPEIGYNEVLSSGNMVENQFEVYTNAIVVEYYIPEINPEYGGIDWQSLRLVFEEYEGNWKLVGIIHNQWTI